MLQGSLENFALDEVLGLLSGTAKTGHLEIAGNRGTGALVFHEGRLVDGSASFTANGKDLEDVMFELLRYQDGTFTFNPREVVPADAAENVGSVLANAEARLQDWRSIESAVPSLSHQVVPVMELPSDEVTVSRDEWATLMTIGSGCPVSHVCDRLTLGEVEGSRRIKDLAERLLVSVTQPTGAYRRNRSLDPVGGSTRTPVATSQPATIPIAAPASPTPANQPETLPPLVTSSPGLTEAAASLETLADADAGAGPAGSALGALIGDRPQAAAAPSAAPSADATPDSRVAPAAQTPPGPPSPAEIAGFGDRIEDASELTGAASEDRGGVLARYLKGD